MVKKVGGILHYILHLSQHILAYNGSEKFCNKYVLLNLDLFLTLTMTYQDHEASGKTILETKLWPT